MITDASNGGFTLIEFSILLVVAGLLAAGIMVGRDMIEAARIRQAISQVQAVQAAVNAFTLKYGQLPGDFDEADFYWEDAQAGNNDGFLQEPLESYNAWHHLTQAGLVRGSFLPVTTYADPPQRELLLPGALDNSLLALTVYTIDPTIGNQILLSAQSRVIMDLGALYTVWADNYEIREVGIMPADAQAIDTKLDDGQPLTGSVQSILNLDTCLLAPDMDAYHVASLHRDCIVRIRLQ